MLQTLVVLTALLAGETAPLPQRGYTQSVELTFATAAEADAASLTFAPVPGGRTWAFSARWDDNQPNNLKMREVMARHGMRGTFFLDKTSARDPGGASYVPAVLADGFSIGGHTMTHPKLPELAADDVFWELLANRVAREVDGDQPVVSLAFSYGQYQSADNPPAYAYISESVRRAGFHHCVYVSFVKDNPHLAPGEISTGLQVVPGDRQVDAEKFREQLAKIVEKWPDSYRKTSHCIHLGVHAWQQGEEMAKLDALLATLAGREDWWYCNLTEWAAYARQVTWSRLGEPVIDGATLRIALQRPVPAELGDDVPLTLLTSGAQPLTVTVDGQPAKLGTVGDATAADLPHTQGEARPTRIDAVDGAVATASTKFQGLTGHLMPGEAGLTLRLTNTGSALEQTRVTFRLPPRYATGVVQVELPGGPEATVEIPWPALLDGDHLRQGAPYYVAEIDFRRDGQPGRLHVTLRDTP